MLTGLRYVLAGILLEMAVLSVLGAGFAYPSGVISNEFLEEINPRLEADLIAEQTGITARFTSLPLDYIHSTFNGDPKEALAAATESPSELGWRAAELALGRAGIKAQDVGLLIADCSTPYETTPGEAARIAKLLGVRTAAYDIASPGTALVAHVDLLASWKEKSLPRYVLCVAANTMTHSIDYRNIEDSAAPALYYGDAAAAVVVSCQKEGRLNLADCWIGLDTRAANSFSLPRDWHLRRDWPSYRNSLEEHLQGMVSRAIEVNQLDGKGIKFIGPQSDFFVLQRAACAARISGDNHWHNISRCGDTLSAGPLAVLAENWDSCVNIDVLLVALAGPGISFGYAVFKGG